MVHAFHKMNTYIAQEVKFFLPTYLFVYINIFTNLEAFKKYDKGPNHQALIIETNIVKIKIY